MTLSVRLAAGNSRPVAKSDAIVILDLFHESIQYYPDLSSLTAGASPVVFSEGTPLSENFDLSTDGKNVFVSKDEFYWLTYEGAGLGLSKILTPSETSSLDSTALFVE